MAIKMKHSGNATATTFASMGGGQGKRRAEDARAFAQIAASQNAAANRQLQGAHASPVSAAAPHAQLISAPTGGGAHAIPGPGGIGATARLGGGAGAGRTSVSSRGGSADGDGYDFKVTGTDYFSRPDADSVWNDYTKQWRRKWLPGEKEAEAQKRIGMAQNEVYADRELTSQGRREREALVNDMVKAVGSRKFSDDEMQQLISSFGEAEDRIRFADQFRAKEPTAQEQLRKNTYTDERGIVWSPDGKVLYNPNDAIIKQQEFAMKREDALRARADKYEAELRKPYKVMMLNDPDDPKSGYTQGVEMRSEDDILKIMQKRFPSLYPSAGGGDNGGNGGGTGDPSLAGNKLDQIAYPYSAVSSNASTNPNQSGAPAAAVPAQDVQQEAATAQPAPANNDAYSAYADYEKK